MTSLADLAPNYDAVLSDVWGVLHNGVAAFPEAIDALQRFRGGGGRVVLITNAPRASSAIVTLLDDLRVPRDAYDAIVSSGDVTRGIIAPYRC
jgi:ribonucleotide monophosphatase NagD (HAD superfamily)